MPETKGMTKLSKEHKVEYGATAIITMREPTNREWNIFNRDRVTVGKKGRVDTSKSLEARCNLFDKIATGIENLADDDGPITLETLERIPARLKETWIIEKLEGDDGAELEETEKNF